MKPPITRISGLPLTALVCCPQCYRLISFPSTQPVVSCHTCGTVVKGGAMSKVGAEPQIS